MIRRGDGIVVAARTALASSVPTRLRGLLGREGLAEDEALWIVPCNSIHMFFMKFPIDAVFLDRGGRVVRIYPAIRPWRCTPIIWGAHSCLELAAGRAAAIRLQAGDVLEFQS